MPDLVLDYHRRRVPIDHPDLSVARSKLEYPTVDVSFAYLAVVNKLVYCTSCDGGVQVLTRDAFADKAVWAAVQVDSWPYLFGRSQDYENFYFSLYNYFSFTYAHTLGKCVNGSITALASEQMWLDILGKGLAHVCAGTTLKSMRYDMLEPVDPFDLPPADGTLVATDTTFAVGRFGYLPLYGDYPHGGATPDSVWLKSPFSSSSSSISRSERIAQVLAYFEVPVVGSGTKEDPFRPQMPEEAADHPVRGKFNRLALVWSALIPTDRATGKPVHGTAIVRVFDQPKRPKDLHPMPKCLEALRSMPGARELRAEEAAKLALKMDDRLHPFDLTRVSRPTTAQIKEYARWRRSTYNVEIEEEEARKYLEADKGW